MEPSRLSYKNSIIAWYRFGTGPRPVICFHGYGEDALSFEFLANSAGNEFSFYCIDLPFHGKTEWNDKMVFTENDLLQIIKYILNPGPQELNIEHRTLNIEHCTLLGFSLGGRIALSLYQAIPQQVNRLVLLAPDGLKVNFWYWFATQTRAGNKFFAFTMKHPRWFFWFVKLLRKIRLVNASIFKFVNYYVDDAAARHFLYARWTTLRKLKPVLSLIKNKIRENNTIVRLVYGKHDRIILSSVGEKFNAGIEEQCKIEVIDSGHHLLREKHTAAIVEVLVTK